jgi:amino acid transporter
LYNRSYQWQYGAGKNNYAMGKDKVFFPWAGKEHKRFATPGNAVWLHGIWSSLFIITGSFDMLADMFVFLPGLHTEQELSVFC